MVVLTFTPLYSLAGAGPHQASAFELQLSFVEPLMHRAQPTPQFDKEPFDGVGGPNGAPLGGRAAEEGHELVERALQQRQVCRARLGEAQVRVRCGDQVLAGVQQFFLQALEVGDILNQYYGVGGFVGAPDAGIRFVQAYPAVLAVIRGHLCLELGVGIAALELADLPAVVNTRLPRSGE